MPALAALVIAANAEHAPTWVLALCALCGGATFPQVPAAMRSVWSALVEDADQRETAYAMVSIVFEVAVVTAPALVAAIVAVSSPQVAVLAAAALGAGASVAFTLTSASRRWRGVPHEVGWLGPLGAPGMRTVFGVLAAFGTAVGIVQVAVPAFAAQRGSAAAGGVLLAALSAGSLIGGLVYGARSWPGATPRRLAVLLLGLGSGVRPAGRRRQRRSRSPRCWCSAGCCWRPTTVIGSTLLDTVAPSGTVTEAFTVMVMAIVVGTAVGNAIGGSIVESASYETAVLLAGAAAAAGAALTLVRRRTSSRTRRERAGSGARPRSRRSAAAGAARGSPRASR